MPADVALGVACSRVCWSVSSSHHAGFKIQERGVVKSCQKYSAVSYFEVCAIAVCAVVVVYCEAVAAEQEGWIGVPLPTVGAVWLCAIRACRLSRFKKRSQVK